MSCCRNSTNLQVLPNTCEICPVLHAKLALSYIGRGHWSASWLTCVLCCQQHVPPTCIADLSAVPTEWVQL